MESVIQRILYYVTRAGKTPYLDWLSALGGMIESIIEGRIDRLRCGNFGDHKCLGGGLYELRIHYGGGYRIYFGRHGKAIVILLSGGDKRRQAWDIMQARHYWCDYLGRIK